MYLRSITVEVSRSLVDQFKAVAKEHFPREAFAYLLGRDAGTLIEIEDLFVPEDLDKHCSDMGFEIQDSWTLAAKAAAKEQGLVIVGDIHSHPFRNGEWSRRFKPEPTPSVEDIDAGLHCVNAICLVLECKTGRLRSSVRFWGPQVPVKEHII